MLAQLLKEIAKNLVLGKLDTLLLNKLEHCNILKVFRFVEDFLVIVGIPFKRDIGNNLFLNWF